MPNLLQSFLNRGSISRIRRNHGLEHATIHVLSEKHPGVSLAGHSDTRGFWLMGEVSAEAVRQAVAQALARLRAGEHNLAVHPNCGTNFVTAGSAAGLAGAAAMFGAGRRWRDKVERLPLAMTLATLALIAAQPLGLIFQKRVTTCGQPGELEVVKIIPARNGPLRAHRVVTRG